MKKETEQKEDKKKEIKEKADKNEVEVEVFEEETIDKKELSMEELSEENKILTEEVKYLQKIANKNAFISGIISAAIILVLMIIVPIVTGQIKKSKMAKSTDEKVHIKGESINKEDMEKLQNTFKALDTVIGEKFLHKQNINKNKQLVGAIKGYIAGLEDEYTNYLTKEELKEFKNQLDGRFVGIGVAMQKTDKGTELVKVFDESPAKKAGVKEGDILIEADGKDLKTLQLDEISKMVKGEENTKVKITVLRGGEKKSFEIIRKPVKIKYISGEMITEDIGHIKLDQFGDDAYILFKEEYEQLKNKGMKKLILDLRGNTGGELNNAKKIIDMFLPEDTLIFSTRDAKNNEAKEKTESKEHEDIKMVILGDKYSASASELLIGALVDNKRAKFIGKNTYGKGVIQEIKPLINGDYLKLTIQEYLRPNGDTIDKKGIKPDIEVDLDIDKYEKEKIDTQLNKAIEVIKHD